MKRTLLIAEAGVNHNGSLATAKELVDVAVASGADVVKFQSFVASQLVTKNASMASYQVSNVQGKSKQIDLLQELELSFDDQLELMKHCEQRGIEFLSTAFDEPSLDFLLKTKVLQRFKIPSGEITNAPFLLRVARQNKPIILSTGASLLGEIEEALSVLAFGFLHPAGEPSRQAFKQAYISPEGRALLHERVTILHCTTNYPADFSSINLNAMKQIGDTFQTSIGYSDHSLGISVSLAACALGATVIEKHFTLDRRSKGPDHAASLEPSELLSLARGLREIDMALGSRVKFPNAEEIKTASLVRKSLVATQDLPAGHTLQASDLTLKRPGTGVAPIEYWDTLGKVTKRSYRQDELLE